MFQDLDNPSDHDGAAILVDADIVAYQAAAASDGRCYSVPYKKGVKEFKYKKEIVTFCSENDIDISLIGLTYHPEPVTHALHNMKLSLDQLRALSPSGEMILYLTGDNNYRKQISPDYKAHRKASRVPHHLAECKQYLMNHQGAVLEDGLEADDLLGIKQMEIISKQ